MLELWAEKTPPRRVEAIVEHILGSSVGVASVRREDFEVLVNVACRALTKDASVLENSSLVFHTLEEKRWNASSEAVQRLLHAIEGSEGSALTRRRSLPPTESFTLPLLCAREDRVIEEFRRDRLRAWMDSAADLLEPQCLARWGATGPVVWTRSRRDLVDRLSQCAAAVFEPGPSGARGFDNAVFGPKGIGKSFLLARTAAALTAFTRKESDLIVWASGERCASMSLCSIIVAGGAAQGWLVPEGMSYGSVVQGWLAGGRRLFLFLDETDHWFHSGGFDGFTGELRYLLTEGKLVHVTVTGSALALRPLLFVEGSDEAIASRTVRYPKAPAGSLNSSKLKGVHLVPFSSLTEAFDVTAAFLLQRQVPQAAFPVPGERSLTVPALGLRGPSTSSPSSSSSSSSSPAPASSVSPREGGTSGLWTTRTRSALRSSPSRTASSSSSAPVLRGTDEHSTSSAFLLPNGRPGREAFEEAFGGDFSDDASIRAFLVDLLVRSGGVLRVANQLLFEMVDANSLRHSSPSDPYFGDVIDDEALCRAVGSIAAAFLRDEGGHRSVEDVIEDLLARCIADDPMPERTVPRELCGSEDTLENLRDRGFVEVGGIGNRRVTVSSYVMLLRNLLFSREYGDQLGVFALHAIQNPSGNGAAVEAIVLKLIAVASSARTKGLIFLHRHLRPRIPVHYERSPSRVRFNQEPVHEEISGVRRRRSDLRVRSTVEFVDEGTQRDSTEVQCSLWDAQPFAAAHSVSIVRRIQGTIPTVSKEVMDVLGIDGIFCIPAECRADDRTPLVIRMQVKAGEEIDGFTSVLNAMDDGELQFVQCLKNAGWRGSIDCALVLVAVSRLSEANVHEIEQRRMNWIDNRTIGHLLPKAVVDVAKTTDARTRFGVPPLQPLHPSSAQALVVVRYEVGDINISTSGIRSLAPRRSEVAMEGDRPRDRKRDRAASAEDEDADDASSPRDGSSRAGGRSSTGERLQGSSSASKRARGQGV